MGQLIAPAPISLAAVSSPVNILARLAAQDNGNVPFTLSSDESWLTASVDSASTPANVAITVNPAGLQGGRTYAGSLSVIAKDASNQVKFAVSVTVVEPTEIVSNVSTTILFDGEPLELPATLALVPGSVHTVSAPEYIPGSTANSREAFQSWSDGLASAHSIIAPAATSSSKFALTFVQQYQLLLETLPQNGGTIAVTPSSSDGFYKVNSSVTLTARPAPNFAFVRYTGLDTTSQVASLLIRRPETVGAVFVAAAPRLPEP